MLIADTKFAQLLKKLEKSVYQLSKTALNNLLNEEQYTELRSVYHKVYHKIANPYLSGFLSVLPDFIILGAQKCGTSSLYSYLTSHPQVIPSSRKEVHFFDNNFEKGVLWYRSHFPSVPSMLSGEYITGEASPYYLYHPHVAERISRIAPNTKLIILLRDPVDRAISHYWHEVTWCEAEELPMEEAFEREEERLSGEKERLISDETYYSFNHQHYSYLDRGKYVRQVNQFKRYFEEKDVLILKSDNLFQDTQNTYSEVLNFLNLNEFKLEKQNVEMEGNYKGDTPSRVRDRLEDYYEKEKDMIKKELDIEFS